MRSDTGAISASVSNVGAARDASLGEVGWSEKRALSRTTTLGASNNFWKLFVLAAATIDHDQCLSRPTYQSLWSLQEPEVKPCPSQTVPASG
jgi:hypothetical protein